MEANKELKTMETKALRIVFSLKAYQITNSVLYIRTNIRLILKEIADKTIEFCQNAVKVLPETSQIGARVLVIPKTNTKIS